MDRGETQGDTNVAGGTRKEARCCARLPSTRGIADVAVLAACVTRLVLPRGIVRREAFLTHSGAKCAWGMSFSKRDMTL